MVQKVTKFVEKKNHWLDLNISNRWVFLNEEHVLFLYLFNEYLWSMLLHHLLGIMKGRKIKIKSHLNENIEWHCMELELNSNFNPNATKFKLNWVEFESLELNLNYWIEFKIYWMKFKSIWSWIPIWLNSIQILNGFRSNWRKMRFKFMHNLLKIYSSCS